MAVQGAEGGPRIRNLIINPEDERFVRQWFRDVAGDKDGNKVFEENYEHFMGAPATVNDPNPGANRRLIAAFLNAPDDREKRRAMYLLELYHHQACGDRAASENWYSRFAILAAQFGVAVVLLIELSLRFQADRNDISFWLITVFFLFYSASVIGLFFGGSRLYKWLMKRRKQRGQ